MPESQIAGRKSIGARRSPASAEAILGAAQQVLADKGHAGFSIEAVARQARAGKPTIYRWWPSKAALLLNVYQRQKRVDCPDTGSLEQDLFEFLVSLFSHWRDTTSGAIFRSVIAEAQSNDEAAKALADYSAGRRAYTATIIERAKHRGEVGPEIDGEVVGDLVASYAWAHLLTGRLAEDETVMKRAVDYIVHGVKQRRA